MSTKETKLEWFYRVVVPKATSLGAAVVVLGALFKIQHYKGAGEMLMIGLCTESFIFLMGVFQPSPPPEAHYEWENVYPGLVDTTIKPVLPNPNTGTPVNTDPKTATKIAALEAALVDSVKPDSVKNLGSGMQKLTQTVNQIKDVTNSTVAS